MELPSLASKQHENNTVQHVDVVTIPDTLSLKLSYHHGSYHVYCIFAFTRYCHVQKYLSIVVACDFTFLLHTKNINDF